MSDQVYTRQQFWGTPGEKEAEVGGTMPISTLPMGKPDKGAKHTIPKTGSAEEQFTSKLAEAESPDDNHEAPVTGEQPPKNPQAAPVSPRVDVSQKEPPKVITEKQAQYLAMPSIGRYPLDGYDQVKQASAYFEANRGQFAPVHRREYCSNLVKRAGALGIAVSEEVHKYGGEGYASQPELEIAFGTRRNLLSDESHQAVLDKLAEVRPMMDPDGFAITLGEFDKLAGLDEFYDRDVMDPYLSTFGKTAEAEEDGSYINGNDIVSNDELKVLSNTHCREIIDHFGDDFAQEFKKDPIGIFKSLPVDQRKIISRLANEPTPVH